jgi:hypothetical protein
MYSRHGHAVDAQLHKTTDLGAEGYTLGGKHAKHTAIELVRHAGDNTLGEGVCLLPGSQVFRFCQHILLRDVDVSGLNVLH